jgi:hypothetical protein
MRQVKFLRRKHPNYWQFNEILRSTRSIFNILHLSRALTLTLARSCKGWNAHPKMEFQIRSNPIHLAVSTPSPSWRMYVIPPVTISRTSQKLYAAHANTAPREAFLGINRRREGRVQRQQRQQHLIKFATRLNLIFPHSLVPCSSLPPTPFTFTANFVVL